MAAPFRRPWWMLSGHLETIASLFDRGRIDYHRRMVNTPDGDEILLDYLPGRQDMPLLALFHGLEGCSQSRVMRLLAAYFAAAGWTVAVPHFRSCGHMNLLPRAYHAADGAEVRWMLEYCRTKFERRQTFAAGVSLGGNALIQCLDGDADLVQAAAAISAPLNLTAAAHHLNRGITHYLYGRHFVKLLRAKVLAKSARYPFICDIKKLRRIRTIGQFDEIYTAPLHGFDDAEDYWRRGSVVAALRCMKTPLLCLNAKNDPLVPAQTLPSTGSPKVEFCRPRHGGHGGFWGSPPNWLGATVEDFFCRHG